jgi:hypothetical protein
VAFSNYRGRAVRIRSLGHAHGILSGQLFRRRVGTLYPAPMAKNKKSDTSYRIEKPHRQMDMTILLHMWGNKTWKNRLPFSIRGLRIEGGIDYETSLNMLYNTDIFTWETKEPFLVSCPSPLRDLQHDQISYSSPCSAEHMRVAVPF